MRNIEKRLIIVAENRSSRRTLLAANDPKPVEIINEGSNHPLLLVCEHAGQAIPSRLGSLGATQEVLNTHIAWDIGAEQTTCELARQLGATAILQRYSRLVIDCNRPPYTSGSIPEVSDFVAIPGNHDLEEHERAARVAEIFNPYHSMVEQHLSLGKHRIVLSIHSFTSSMNDQARPWEIGFLFRKDVDTSQRLCQFVQEAYPKITVGMNVPYQIDDISDWFVPCHGEAYGIPHSLVEIRNDQIDTADGQSFWAAALAGIVERYLREA